MSSLNYWNLGSEGGGGDGEAPGSLTLKSTAKLGENQGLGVPLPTSQPTPGPHQLLCSQQPHQIIPSLFRCGQGLDT